MPLALIAVIISHKRSGSKVNLATDLYKAGAAAVIEEEPNHGMQMYELLAEGYKAKLVHYMKLFNQCNRV